MIPPLPRDRSPHPRRARVTRCAASFSLGVLASAAPAAAQDTLRLAALQAWAERADPRAAQRDLLAQQSTLRRTTLERDRTLPQLGVTAVGQYLSDVARVPLPGAAGPLNHQYDLYATVRQPLLDPAYGPRVALERAQLAEAQAGLASTLWQQRALVTEAFVGVLVRRAQIRTLDAAIDDLTERLRLATARVDAGAALPSDAALLDAERARRRQARDEAVGDEAAARATLASLVGRPITTDAVLEVPAVDTALPPLDHRRPEFAQFASARATLDARAHLLGAAERPRVALVGKTGYGRPGLNALGREFDTYYVAGVQVDWAPWNWGATRRDRELQRLQAQVVATQEAAFTEALARALAQDRARIAALVRVLAADDTIVALRERVVAEVRRRLDAGDATSADYVARHAELVTARLDRETHRLRLAEARARSLTTLGHEIR